MENDPKLLLKIDDEEIGPLTVEEVKELIDKGEFGPDDYIQVEGKAHWIRARNVSQIKKLFDAKKEEEIKGAFGDWLEIVRTGETPGLLTRPGITDERERLEEERARLEEARKEIEDRERTIREEVKTELTETQIEELNRLKSERESLSDERSRIEAAEIELQEMEKSLKKRRRIPIIIAVVVIGIVLAVGTPIIINQYQKGQELQEKIDRLDELETQINDLRKELLTAKTDDERAVIEEKIDELMKEKEKLKEEIGDSEETESTEPEIETTLGSVSIKGPLSITGDGSSDPSRSSGSISSGVRGVMGSIQSKYNSELRNNPGLEGKVIVRFVISQDGTVTSATVVSSTIGNSAVESAITSGLRSARFQPSGLGSTTVTYPFYFSTK